MVTLEVGQRARVDVDARSRRRQRDGHRRRRRTQLLNSNDATLGAVIPQMQVANLPLAIRNWDDLLALVPGVQGDRYTEQGGGTSFGRTGGINVHGARALQNNFLLDGVDNNSISENVQELTTQVSRPSVDAIQEFKVVTSPYSAEYGRSPGAAVSVSTKSGTNAFHGTALRVLPQRGDGLDRLLLEAGRARPSPTTSRTSSAATSAVRSSRTRRSSSPTTKARASRAASPGITSVPTADRARRHLHDARSRIRRPA